MTATHDMSADLPPAAEPDVAVLLGPCDDMRAEVYVRLAADGQARGLCIEGTLTGPECRHGVTLPMSVRLVDRGVDRDAAAVGRAILTEPSFWTPQVPGLYRLEARLVDGARTVATRERRVGLRRLGVRGRSFWLDGHRWVPRAVGCPAGGCDVDTCRSVAAAALATDPSEAWLARCDEAGVAVLARLTDEEGMPLEASAAIERLAAWSLHPAVMLAIAPQEWTSSRTRAVAAATRRIRGTLLIAQAVDGSAPPPEEIAADAVVVELDRGGSLDEGWRDGPPLPRVAMRHGGAGTIADRRDRCDLLQADLAAWGLAGTGGPLRDWAGYAVT